MSSPASIKKHPLHPMLVGLPIGLWIFALVGDVGHLVSGNSVWQTVATYCVAGGIVGAILAAVPGLIDYLSIDEAEMKRIANFHLAVNLGAVVIFGINLWLRFRLPVDSLLPLGLSVIGVVAIGFGGWLGGEIPAACYIQNHGVWPYSLNLFYRFRTVPSFSADFKMRVLLQNRPCFG